MLFNEWKTDETSLHKLYAEALESAASKSCKPTFAVSVLMRLPKSTQRIPDRMNFRVGD